MKALEACLGVVILTHRVHNHHIIIALQSCKWLTDESSCNLTNGRHGPKIAILPASHEFKNVCFKTKILVSAVRKCMCVTSEWYGYRISKTAWYQHWRQPATMQFENDKNTQYKMMSGYIFFHIMQYEMNVTNRFTTNQRGLASRRDQKREVKQGGAVTCGNTNSDLMTTHLSKVFAQLIAVWFSTDMHLHTNAVVTNLSICPFSHGRKQQEYHRNIEGYCYGSCKSFNNKPFQLLPNTQTLVDLLQGHFTISQCRINVRAMGAALTPKEVNV